MKVLVEIDCSDQVWSALKGMAKDSIMQSVNVMIEAGATRGQIETALNEVLLPEIQEWMHCSYRFITEAMYNGERKH